MVERDRITLDQQRGRTMVDEMTQDFEQFCLAARGMLEGERGTRQAEASLDAAADCYYNLKKQ
eukprot:1417801-Lingulodinium_polyedra.AAC.1